MRIRVVRIYDKKGVSFRMKIRTPTAKSMAALKVSDKLGNSTVKKITNYVGDALGDWKTTDNGFIRFAAGKTRSRISANEDLTTRDLLVLGAVGVKAYDGDDLMGMQLFEYEDVIGVNDEGEGFVIQPWVINVTPGRIKWEVVD